MTALGSASSSAAAPASSGRALVRRLVAEARASPAWCDRRARLAALDGQRRRDAGRLRRARASWPGARAHVVFNLASYGVRPADRDPELLVEGNVTLLARLLGVAQALVRRARLCTSAAAPSTRRIDEPALAQGEHPLEPQLGLRRRQGGGACVRHGAGARARRVDGNARLFGTYGPGEATIV